MCILDLSNVLMNELHYGCMKKKQKTNNNNKTKLLLTDTYSLMNDFTKDK